MPGTEASSEEMKELAFAVDRAGEGTLEIVSDWLDQEIEMSWMKEYVEKSDCGLTVLQANGDSVKTILYCEEQVQVKMFDLSSRKKRGTYVWSKVLYIHL